jgi:hypothetical protein
MKIDRRNFFDRYRATFGKLNQSQVDGIEQILGFIESDVHLTTISHTAYILATIKHECADLWRPLVEWGKGKGRKYAVAYSVAGLADGVTRINRYYGRGYVQITWRDNYERLGRAIGMGDALVHFPDAALVPEIAWKITSVGMRRGLFTGASLMSYLNDINSDYVQARRIINGLDCAEKIAGYAAAFESMLG